MAVSGDSQPSFTTLTALVSELGDLAATLFGRMLALCDRQGLIGRQMFTIDGVKLPSNASKSKSGTRQDFLRQARQLEHRQRDAQQMRDWLAAHPEARRGSKGSVRLSSRTDNESAKMATGKGVIQGYTGVAVVDEAAQAIVEA